VCEKADAPLINTEYAEIAETASCPLEEERFPQGAVVISDVKHPPLPEETGNPVKQMTRHLSCYPCNLIDTRWLIRHFRASVVDVQRAIERLEQAARENEEDSTD
jgi:hypothetical protein